MVTTRSQSNNPTLVSMLRPQVTEMSPRKKKATRRKSATKKVVKRKTSSKKSASKAKKKVVKRKGAKMKRRTIPKSLKGGPNPFGGKYHSGRVHVYPQKVTKDYIARLKAKGTKTYCHIGTKSRPNRTYYPQLGYYTSRGRRYRISGKRVKSTKRQAVGKRNPWMQFYKEMYPKIKKQNPNASVGQIAKKIAAMYRDPNTKY